ncbi:hypothetical protein Tco_0124981 [Tanacetum coccineum]
MVSVVVVLIAGVGWQRRRGVAVGMMWQRGGGDEVRWSRWWCSWWGGDERGLGDDDFFCGGRSGSGVRGGAGKGGGAWYSGSGRSGLDLSLLEHFCGSPENSPEKVAAGRREGWPDNWGRWRRERGL